MNYIIIQFLIVFIDNFNGVYQGLQGSTEADDAEVESGNTHSGRLWCKTDRP